MLTRQELKKRWDKFLASEGFQIVKTKKRRFGIESNFSRIFIDLEYSPKQYLYYPRCYITLCELGYDAMDALDARDQARSEFYNLICFFFDRITSFSVKNPVVCLAGNNGQYSEEEFETLLMQLHLYAFPVIKKCLSREGFIDFCQKYPPDKLGFVYKTMGEWIKSNVPALPDDFL